MFNTVCFTMQFKSYLYFCSTLLSLEKSGNDGTSQTLEMQSVACAAHYHAPLYQVETSYRPAAVHSP